MDITVDDINAMEQYWIEKSRVNFLAYRLYMRHKTFINSWFMTELAGHLQQFYKDFKNGKRPILLIQTPPQHGKSLTVTDFIAWMSGRIPTLRSIYASYSDTLGKRCNLVQQRQMESSKYRKIFPDTKLANNKSKAIRTLEHLEFVDEKGESTGGQFRNTTVNGSVTGESLDLGVIDDAVKGREQANSLPISQKVWEWFTDDFGDRFSEFAGLIVIMTRWTTHDLIARLIEKYGKRCKVVNFKAIATKDEKHRKEGEPLFPEIKSLEFLKDKKMLKSQSSWESMYQGSPTIDGGNLFKDSWWEWWTVLPKLKYKFITADTSQKTKDKNDWNVFQCWGFGYDGRIYLLDKLRDKFESPQLRREAEAFYKKHDTRRVNIGDPILRGMYIEDKSSGTGLIQELRAKRLKVYEVPRNTDKVLRAEDASPYVEAGLVVLNTDVNDVGNLTKEAREFPNSEFDDDIDTCITATEITYINKDNHNLLKEAMEAEDKAA